MIMQSIYKWVLLGLGFKYERFCDIVYAFSALPVYLPPQYMQVNIGCHFGFSKIDWKESISFDEYDNNK